ncbi:hypothetical protein HZY83_03405 [Gemella sp. GH3]|uniref:hypothetical protein n=1 Tax=unclassified Gemella TaxID=2624949 RepID=UPI0015D09F90|nr:MULTISPECIES: hypothetical protein [unclassified Gemella]MBF0713728.1 hypothetical protein [Gemella sp. GH3.1]NYS50680.1 hypothetical protein [Gemella sp. GH3]
MGKLTKIILVGLGAYAVKYYLDNPKKVDEHKEILKEKLDSSISYSKCMWNYTKENGVAASAEYLTDDLKKVTKKGADYVSQKVGDTIDLGKQIASDSSVIKNNAKDVREKSLELKANLTDATRVIKEEITPTINNYVSSIKEKVANIGDKAEDLKEIIEEDSVSEKIENFKANADEKLTEVKENITNENNKGE